MLPIDNDIFNHNMKNWALKIDQDQIPEWFDKEKAWADLQPYLKDVFEKRFIINSEVKQERKNERLFIKNSKNIYLRENSQATLRENSQATLRENSHLLIPSDGYAGKLSNAKLNDNASIKDLSGSNPVLYVVNKNIKLKVLKQD